MNVKIDLGKVEAQKNKSLNSGKHKSTTPNTKNKGHYSTSSRTKMNPMNIGLS